MNEIIVTISGVVGIIFVFWFFLMNKGKEIKVVDSVDTTGLLQVDIIVDGGYSPDKISIPKGKIAKLNFIRKDPSSCLEEVVLPDFKVRKYLPLNQKVTIEINPDKAGEYKFSCGMNMFHGKILVTE